MHDLPTGFDALRIELEKLHPMAPVLLPLVGWGLLPLAAIFLLLPPSEQPTMLCYYAACMAPAAIGGRAVRRST